MASYTSDIHQPHVMTPSASRVRKLQEFKPLALSDTEEHAKKRLGTHGGCSTFEGLNEKFRPSQLVGYFGPQVVYRFYSLVMPAWLWVGNL